MLKFIKSEIAEIRTPKIAIFLFWLIGTAASLGSIGVLGAIWVLSKGIDNAEGPHFQILVDFPGMWTVALIHLLFASLYLLMGKLLLTCKKSVVLMAMAFTLFIPPLYSLALYKIPPIFGGWPFSNEDKLSYSTLFMDWINNGIFYNLFIVLILINLFFIWKSPSQKPIGINKVIRFGYLALPILVALTCLIGLFYLYFKAFNVGDYKLTQVQKEIGFKVYVPQYIPHGFRLNNFYIDTNNYVANTTTARATINRKPKDFIDGKSNGFILLGQLKSNDLDLESLVKRRVPTFIIKRVIVRGKEAYLAQKVLSKVTISELYFYLDNEIIGILGSELNPEELIKIAESMK